MRSLALIFVALFAATVAWRTVFVSNEERRAIRFGIKELAIAFAVSAIGAAVLFFALFNNTMRIL
jgi:hypothetical protein